MSAAVGKKECACVLAAQKVTRSAPADQHLTTLLLRESGSFVVVVLTPREMTMVYIILTKMMHRDAGMMYMTLL